MKTIIKVLNTLMVVAFAVSCVPSENEITQDLIDGDTTFGGFEGLQSVQTVSGSKVTLSWNASPTEAKGYNIYNVTLKSQPQLIKTVGPEATETTISGLSEAFLYRFRVRAVNENDKEDSNENDLPGIPFSGIQDFTVLSSTSARLDFTATPDGEALQATLYCNTSTDPEFRVQALISNLSQTSAVVEDLVGNTVYTCKYNVRVDGVEDNNLSRVTFTALGQADKIVFQTQPGNAQAGELLTVQPIIHILDENDNIVSGGPDASALVTIGVSLNSPTGGTVNGTFSINASGGIANFTDLLINESGSKILTATKEDTSSITFGSPQMNLDSAPFNINPGNISPDLTTISIVNPAPTLVANGSDAYQVRFNLRDSFGNPVPGTRPEFASNIIGDFLSQPLSPSDSNGETTGAISTTIADTNGGTTRVLNISSPAGLETITVPAPFDPGAASKLAFTVQPVNSPAGVQGLNELQVSVQDIQGNLINAGAEATTNITITISNNVSGANLTGTASVVSTNGVATFSDLGIDQTGNGYKLAASGGVLNSTTSNTFNVTSGVPRVVAMEGPTDVLSGECTTAITLQLRDLGGNPAKAVQTTIIQLSGLSSGNFYSSSVCGGSPLSTNITFTPGTDTQTIYYSSDKSEAVTITGTDSSAVLTPSSYDLNINPNKLRIIAEAAAPAPPATPLAVTAGQCSTAIRITPLAEDGSDGQVLNPTNITMTGIVGSSAKIYSDDSCLVELDELSFAMSQGAPPNMDTLVYLRDPVGENLLLNVSDPAGDMSSISLPQTVNVTPSDIDFTGPSSVVAGVCSQVFNVVLEDTLGNNVATIGNLNLSVVGLDGISSTGQFYTSPACGGVGSQTTVTIPDASATTAIYFRGQQAEVLNIQLQDPSGNINNSQVVTLSVGPSEFRMTPPVAGTSGTSECVGPFTIDLLDGQGDVANAVTAITANLSGVGTSGAFYSDAACETSVNSLVYSIGQSTKDIYFKGQFPEVSLNLQVTDNDVVLASDTAAWVVTAAISFVGTASTQSDALGDLLPFRAIPEPVAARYDGINGPQQMAMDPTNQFLYVVDYDRHKVVKYDYTNNEYIGWIGRLYVENGIGATGSNIPTPSSALCVSTTNGQPLPGWCFGGRSQAGSQTTGGMQSPWGIDVDDTYVYVTSTANHNVMRFNAETGAFDGWIGRVNNSTPTANASGAAGCTSVPNDSPTTGWCIGGNSEAGGGDHIGNGQLRNPRAITHDATNLYVVSEGLVSRYDKTTGAFTGWIGRVGTTPPSSGAAGCTIAANNDQTPGWCIGGQSKDADPRGTGAISTLSMDIQIDGNDLYVLTENYGGVINKYNASTGAFVETLSNLNGTWTNSYQMAWDGSKFYIADDERVLKVDNTGLIESWMGKVANNAGMSGNPGCNALSPNDNTPGWCLGGTHKPGLDETSFLDAWGIVDSGDGNLLVTSRRWPTVRKFDKTTGNYIGAIGLESVSPATWSDNSVQEAEFEGYGGNDLNFPIGTLIVGEFLFVAERENSRVKKLNRRTGELIGWIGGMTTAPTGGEQVACIGANAMSPAPGYCTGANPYPNFTWNDANMIDDLTDGIMRQPYGLASDGTWLYVTDRNLHRIQRFNVNDGTYGGWIGRVNVSPTGGDPGCNGTPNNSVTPGWCLGGISELGSNDGNFREPTGIFYQSGNLYVIDAYNHRVVSISAVSGTFNGWIGRVNAAPSGGCTTGSNGDYTVSLSGWCTGGTSRRANFYNDNGGGFNFDFGDRAGIFSDGTHLFITNTRNRRIDKITLGGVFVEATNVRTDQYVNNWVAGPGAGVNNIGGNCDYVMSVWGDATYLYGLNAQPCSRDGNTMAVWKMDKATGQIIGWKGGASAAFPPTGGDPGCSGATGITPGWCTGGRVAVGSRLGQFSNTQGSLSGDEHFLYVTDTNGSRMMRIPK